MRCANHRSFCHCRMTHRRIFQIDGRNPFATGLDYILGTVGNLHVAIGIDSGDIAGIKITIGIEYLAALAAIVAGDYPRPTHHQVAEGFAIMWQGIAFIVGDAQLDAIDATTLLGLNIQALLQVVVTMLG